MKRTLLIALSLVLVGCAGNRPVDPPPVPFDVPEHADTKGADVHAHWWMDFGSQNLDVVVEEALLENHDLKAAIHRVEQAVALARINGASIYPSLSATGSAARQKSIFIGIPAPGGGVLSSKSDSFRFDLNMSWELDLWGRVRSGRAAALSDLRAATADAAGAQLSITAGTVRAYLGAVEARMQMAVLQQTLDSFNSLLERIEDRYERGLTSILDVRLTRTSVARTRDLMASQKQNLSDAVRSLEQLLGRYPGADLKLPPELPGLPASAPSGIPANLVSRRPDLAAAEERVLASGFRYDEAVAGLYPKISLSASGGRVSDELSDLTDSDFTVWSLAANLAQPIFEGGRLRANVDLQEARQKEALERYFATALTAYGEVERALELEGTLRERSEHISDAAEQTESALELSEDRYFRGLNDILTVLEARRRYFDARSQQISIQRLQLDARVSLYLALGGGFTFARDER